MVVGDTPIHSQLFCVSAVEADDARNCPFLDGVAPPFHPNGFGANDSTHTAAENNYQQHTSVLYFGRRGQPHRTRYVASSKHSDCLKPEMMQFFRALNNTCGQILTELCAHTVRGLDCSCRILDVLCIPHTIGATTSI